MNEIIKKFNEGVISELCKVLAIRYKYADGEAMTWITKNILSFTKEIDGHQYGLKIVQLDGELPFPGEGMLTRLNYQVDLMSPARGSVIEAYRMAQQDMGEAGYKYRAIEEEK